MPRFDAAPAVVLVLVLAAGAAHAAGSPTLPPITGDPLAVHRAAGGAPQRGTAPTPAKDLDPSRRLDVVLVDAHPPAPSDGPNGETASPRLDGAGPDAVPPPVVPAVVPPVPEPQTALLMLAGIGAIAFIAARTARR